MVMIMFYSDVLKKYFSSKHEALQAESSRRVEVLAAINVMKREGLPKLFKQYMAAKAALREQKRKKCRNCVQLMAKAKAYEQLAISRRNLMEMEEGYRARRRELKTLCHADLFIRY